MALSHQRWEESGKAWGRFESSQYFKTRLHALKRHTEIWLELEATFEARGIANSDPPPSEVLRQDRQWREHLIGEEMDAIWNRADATTDVDVPADERYVAWRKAVKEH